MHQRISFSSVPKLLLKSVIRFGAALIRNVSTIALSKVSVAIRPQVPLSPESIISYSHSQSSKSTPLFLGHTQGPEHRFDLRSRNQMNGHR